MLKSKYYRNRREGLANLNQPRPCFQLSCQNLYSQIHLAHPAPRQTTPLNLPNLSLLTLPTISSQTKKSKVSIAHRRNTSKNAKNAKMRIWKLCKYWKQAISGNDTSNVVISKGTAVALEPKRFQKGWYRKFSGKYK